MTGNIKALLRVLHGVETSSGRICPEETNASCTACPCSKRQSVPLHIPLIKFAEQSAHRGLKAVACGGYTCANTGEDSIVPLIRRG